MRKLICCIPKPLRSRLVLTVELKINRLSTYVMSYRIDNDKFHKCEYLNTHTSDNESEVLVLFMSADAVVSFTLEASSPH